MALESLGTKSREFPGVSRECPGATLHDPKGGGPAEGCRSICMEEHLRSGGEKPLLVPLELAGKPLTRVTNRKLDWILGASTNVQAWLMSCLTPQLMCPGPVPDSQLMELELVTKDT